MGEIECCVQFIDLLLRILLMFCKHVTKEDLDVCEDKSMV